MSSRPRARRVATIAGASAALVGSVAIAWALDRARTADDLVHEARAALDPAFEIAPTLERVRASSAIRLLERARSLGRDDEETRGLRHYAESIEDLQRGDLILAEGEFASAATHLGETPDLLVLAASLSRGRFLESSARVEIDRALVLAPEHARAHLLAADLALDREDGETALEHLEFLTQRHPDSSAAWNRLGLAREQLGERDHAERAYRRASELDRVGQDPWINLGRLLRVSERHEESLAAFEVAVQRASTDPSAHLGRGLARQATGDRAGASRDFQRAAELAPNDAEPLLAYGDLLRDGGQIDDAIATYRLALAREDADAASWLKLGNALALAERWSEAAPAFEQAIARAPELAAARNGLGASLMHTGRHAAARAELERAAALDPGDPHPWMNLALLLERTGEAETARETWRRVLEIQPASPIARAHLRG